MCFLLPGGGGLPFLLLPARPAAPPSETKYARSVLFTDQPIYELALASRRAMLRGFAESAAQLRPDMQPTWHEGGGAFAVFAGDGSPLTQAAGLDPSNLDDVCNFYRGRTKGWEALTSTLDGAPTMAALIDRGARPMQTENVYVTPLTGQAEDHEGVEIETVHPADAERLAVWNEVSRRAFFGDSQDDAILFLDRLMSARTDALRYLATVDGHPAAAASLVVQERVAFLGGMATIEAYRGRGIQRALIARRVADASRVADLAMVEAVAGSTSARNAERAGFRLAFAWLNWSVPSG